MSTIRDIESGVAMDDDFDDPPESLPQNTIYLLFRQWYVTAINGYFLHADSDSHFGFMNKLFSYSAIILSAVSGLIAGLILVFTELEIKEAVIASTVVILLLQAVKFVIDAIASMQDFGDRSQQHKSSSDDFKKLSEDIIKLFTPLSHEEAEINLAYERNYVQRVAKFLIDTSPGIPGKIVSRFNENKKTSKKYKEHMDIFDSIQSDTNLLFAPIQNAIINETLQMNDDAIFGDEDTSDASDFNIVPEIQQIYDDTKDNRGN